MPIRKNLILALVVLVLIVGSKSMFQVRETEQVVMTKFGKPVKIFSEPGLHFRIPFIHKLRVFERRLLDYDSAPTEVLTQDKKTLYVDNYAKWRINDPLKVLQTVTNEAGAQTRLDDIIYSEIRAELGRHAFHDIISAKRAEIMKAVTIKCNELTQDYGIDVLDVRIKRADLPQENENAIFARMKAERNRIANQYRSEGEEEALKIRAETDKQAAIIMATAERTSQEVKGEGDAEATNIYASAYNKDRNFYKLVRTLEAYDKTIDSSTTLILSTDAEFFKYLWQGP